MSGVAAQLRRHGSKALFFVANFAVARVCVYLVPLLIAAIAPPDVYGAVEFSQSVSLLIAAAIIAAPMAGVSQRHLVNREPLAIDVAAASVAVACALSLLAGGVAAAVGAVPIAIASGLALGLAALHTTLSNVLRTLSRRYTVAWTDGFMIIVTLFIVLFWLAGGGVDLTRLAIGYAAATTAALVGAIVVLVRTRQPAFRARLDRMIRFGAPVLLSSVFAFWQAGAGRILTGLFATAALPAYGIAFRVAGLALGFHQLAVTAFFARIYAGRTRIVDRLLAMFLAAVAVALIGVTTVAHFAVRPGTFAALDADGLRLFRLVLPVVAVQIFYWIANAMLEQRLARFRLAARTILPSVVVNGIAFAGLVVADHVAHIDLLTICWVVAGQSAVSFAVAITILIRRRVPHRRLMIAGGVGGAMLALVALL